MKTLLLLLILLLFTGCISVQEKVQADAFLIDHQDASLYRKLKDGTEDYLPIPGNRDVRHYMCWHEEDIKKWAEKLTKKCPNAGVVD